MVGLLHTKGYSRVIDMTAEEKNGRRVSPASSCYIACAYNQRIRSTPPHSRTCAHLDHQIACLCAQL